MILKFILSMSPVKMLNIKVSFAEYVHLTIRTFVEG